MSNRRCPIGCAVRCKPGGTPPCWFEGNDDVASLLDARAEREREGVRALLRDVGRADVLADFDAAMRDNRLGLTAARATWAALSAPQRAALAELVRAGALVRDGKAYRSGSAGPAASPPIRLATIRNLAARELGAWAGGAFDPEARLEVTERGQFVLKHEGEA
ncbi:conserved protein of unknown function (plasmid) [Rhodovastum atsumiense]|nr:conserved protein of unknown function [Rhodovastum atsumiense]